MERLSTIVVRLPEFFGGKAARKLRRDLKRKLTRPDLQVVLDLSRVKNIDLSGLETLLNCMESVAKQDGAIQFAGISPEAATLLELTRVDGVLQKFRGFTTEAPSFALSPEPVSEKEQSEETVTFPVAA